MTDTVTLQSHSGERAVTGYGPKSFPVLADATLVADIDGTRYVESVNVDGDGRRILCKGLAMELAFNQFERDGDTILFDGELPFDNGGCHPPSLIFDDTHVYVRSEWDTPSVVPLIVGGVPGRYGEPPRARLVWDGLGTSSAVASHGSPVTLFVSQRVNGGSIDLSAPVTRCFHSIFETDEADVTIYDDELARHWFDPVRRLDANLAQARAALAKAVRDARELIEQAADVTLPTSASWVSPRSLSTSGGLTRGDIDGVRVLMLMRETLDRSPGQ